MAEFPPDRHGSFAIPVSDHMGVPLRPRTVTLDSLFSRPRTVYMDSTDRTLVDRPGHRSAYAADLQYTVLLELLPEPEMGMFAENLPPEKRDWAPAQWARYCDLPTLTPQEATEHGLYNWERTASSLVHLHGVTFSVFHELVKGKLPLSWLTLVRRMTMDPPSSVSGFCDRLAQGAGFGQAATVQTLRTLASIPTQPNVVTALALLTETLEKVVRLGIRHGRMNSLHSHEICEHFMRILPRHISREIARTHGRYLPFEDLITAAQMVEVNCEEIEDVTQQRQVVVEQMAYPVERGKKEPFCGGCRGPHWWRDCPDKRIRCFRCEQVGHRSLNCRNKVSHDSAGTKRIVTSENRKGAVTQMFLDNTHEKRLTNVRNAVNTELEKLQRTQHRQKERRALENTMDDKPTRERQTREVLICEEEENEKDIVEVESADDEDEIWAKSSFAVSFHTISRSAKIKSISGRIREKEARICLDDGSEVNIMGSVDARRFEIKAANSGKKLKLKGVGGVTECEESEDVPVQIGKTKFYTRFFIHPGTVPVILSFENQKRFGAITDLQKMRYVFNNEELPLCYATTKEDVILPDEIEAAIAPLRKICSSGELKSLKEYLELKREVLLGNTGAKARVEPVVIPPRPNHEPRRFNARPLSTKCTEIAHEILDKMIADDLVERVSTCPNVSPIHLVLKENKKPRLVVDFRYVNDGIQDNAHPMPYLRDLQRKLQRYDIFAIMDLKWGFFNIPLAEVSRDLTGFAVPDKGIFRFKVLPFGLKVAPTIFQNIIETILQEEIAMDGVQVYVDDIAVGANTPIELIEKCIRVLDRLTSNGLKIQWEKTQIGVPELKYLGFIVSRGEIRPDPDKIRALLSTKRPTTRRELVTFLACARYLSEHIPFFAFVEKKLHSKSLGKGRLLWDDEDEVHFKNVKAAVAASISLSQADPHQTFHLFVDASDVGVGAALAQQGKIDGEWTYLKFASRRFNDTQQRWDTTDKELYAIMFGLESCDNFIKGARIVVHTDHKALTHLHTTTKAKLVRYALRIAQYHPEIHHIKGENNAVADWLSRAIPDQDEPEIGYSFNTTLEEPEGYPAPTISKMHDAARAEIDLPQGVVFKEGTALYSRENKLYVPRLYRPALLLLTHGSRYTGHVGIKKCLQMLKRHLWWPTMHEDVQNWIRGCVLCQMLRNAPDKKGHLGSLSSVGVAEVISMDYVGPRKWFGKEVHILTIVDHYTRFMVATHTSHPTGAFAMDVLSKIWKPTFGSPRILFSDNMPFTQEFGRLLERNFGTKHYTSFTYYPQGNSINEASHRLLEHALKTHAQTSLSDFGIILGEATFAYNSCPHEGTGESPHFLAFGQDMRIPNGDLLYRHFPEEERLVRLEDKRLLDLCRFYLSRALSKENEAGVPGFQKGDIVVYRLPPSPQPAKVIHVSQVPKWNPLYSLPYRVVEVQPSACELRPLWSSAALLENRIVRPKTQLKLISSRIPAPLRQLTHKLITLQENTKDQPSLTGQDGADAEDALSRKRTRTPS